MRFLKEIKKLFKGNLGYTLLEVAAVVAVTGTLAAVAMPVVKDKLGQGKDVAAMENMRNLSGAISQYYGDVNLWPNDDDPAAGTALVLRTSDTEDPVVPTKMGGSGWFGDTIAVASKVLSRNLALRPSWKGPYLSEPELKDPWGHPFYVAVEDAIPTSGETSGETNHSTTDPNHSTALFVLSAGENETIETPRKQCMQAFAKVNDDIVLRIR